MEQLRVYQFSKIKLEFYHAQSFLSLSDKISFMTSLSVGDLKKIDSFICFVK